MHIGVVVLHYRHLSDTLECLDSLARQDYGPYSIFLVDNGSLEPGLEQKASVYPNLHFIRNTQNLGFAEGSNGGIRAALNHGAEAVLLLNNDAVAAPDLLSMFAQAALQHPEAGVFGAKILFYDEPTQIWHAGGDVRPGIFRCYHDGCLDSDLDKGWETVREIGYACGCALLVTRRAVEKVGLMAPEFFLLWEEIDWCWRIRQAGFKCLYIPTARAWHKISRSFEGGNRGALWQYYYFRNRLLFIKRHVGWRERMQFYATHLRRELWQMLCVVGSPRASARDKELSRSALKGVVHFFFKMSI